MHQNSFPPRQNIRNPEFSELRLTFKTFVQFQFNNTHRVSHNQTSPTLADTSKGRKDRADTNSSNAALRLKQAEWDVKALAITQSWEAERLIISNFLQYSSFGPATYIYSKSLTFWLTRFPPQGPTIVKFIFGPFRHLFMHA